MIFGYCRVSTKGQAKDGNSLEAQEQEILSRYNDAQIYKEAYTGTTTDRPVFNDVIQKMKEKDMLVVSKLDRLARNTEEGIKIVKDLFKKKCSVHVLNVGLLEDTAMGQFFITTLLAVAELERNQIIERCQTGKAIAKLNPDFTEGRPKKYNQKQLDHALDLLLDHSYKEVVQMTGISKSTLIRSMRNKKCD
ncbi:recombinase family protein [Blautia sp.]|jgi:DNA invertase Pin-like site-specific DNA recombinase|uniref:recombinase family protein n=1 Tax=Blautia sp. TaxID=1955243 RepID=UPI00258DCBEA|nr:recombinase family protein [Blautia sp.]